MKMVFEEIPNGFLSTISYTKQKTSLIEDNVVEKERQIIGFMLKNEKITAKKIALALALTERTVQRYLKGMQEKVMIIRLGTDRSGYWKVNDTNKN
jgi:ATP-dependent DNA helicase RecG